MAEKVLALHGGELRASSMRKKFCAAFIFMCMLVNGFAFSTVEIGRYSLFMITIAATQNIIVSVFGKYNDSLAGMSNKLCSYIGGIFKVYPQEMSSAASGKADKSGKESNKSSSGTVAIIIHSMEKRIRNIVLEDNEKYAQVIVYWEDFFNTYSSIKISTARGSIIFLAFMMFIIGIRRRKVFDGIMYSLIKIGKIRISA